MNRFLSLSLLSVVFCGVTSSTWANALSPDYCPAELATDIDGLIQSPKWRRSQWGILAESLGDDVPVYSRNAEQFFLPASNAKLLTTAAALEALGPDFRFQTSVYRQGEKPLLTTLSLQGSGDPTLTHQQLQALVNQLKAEGISKIANLEVIQPPAPDELNSTWEWGDIQFYYGAAPSPIVLNQNTVTLTVKPTKVGEPPQFAWSDAIAGSQWRLKNLAKTVSEGDYTLSISGRLGTNELIISGQIPVDFGPDLWRMAILDPTNYLLKTLRQQFAIAGIQIGKTQIVASPPTAAPWQRIESPALREIISEINTNSQNLYAEAVLQQLGTSPFEALNELGVASDSYRLVDGSGLSRQNRVSPEALIKTLQGMAESPHAEIYQNSLAIAGETGTLTNRFQNTPLQGQLIGKTGTLSGMLSLSGYLNPPAHPPIAFTILVNHSPLSSAETRQTIDAIATQLWRLHECTK
ncbi:MAG: D-alanyl-D-alanine carboxypeptidase/D-alanyl-D-alanine-endopeptidase [Cyanobacteria bacterium P01_H01_bin.15]